MSFGFLPSSHVERTWITHVLDDGLILPRSAARDGVRVGPRKLQNVMVGRRDDCGELGDANISAAHATLV